MKADSSQAENALIAASIQFKRAKRGAGRDRQKSFGSVFQKRTTKLSYL
jgi:hypothetical protein